MIFCPENSVGLHSQHWGSRGFVDRTHENAKGSGATDRNSTAQRLAFQSISPGLRMTFPGEKLDNEFMCTLHESHRITLEPVFPLLKRAPIPAQDQDQG